MPILTYIGSSPRTSAPDGPQEYIRWIPHEVTQDWVNIWRDYLPAKAWSIDGDEGVQQEGNPTKSWNRKEIITWLENNNVTLAGYTTKSAALELVDGILNPVVEEEVVEEIEESE